MSQSRVGAGGSLLPRSPLLRGGGFRGEEILRRRRLLRKERRGGEEGQRGDLGRMSRAVEYQVKKKRKGSAGVQESNLVLEEVVVFEG